MSTRLADLLPLKKPPTPQILFNRSSFPKITFLPRQYLFNSLIFFNNSYIGKMAQRTEKEETEIKVIPESMTLCVNNCGVVGNPATNNMCQNCFNATTTASSTTSQRNRTRSNSLRSPYRRDVSVDLVLDETVNVLDEELKDMKRNEAVVVKKEVSRCSGCRRKVGLTGFRCRCGDLFCAEHRYSDRHDCSYDYKTAGREAIAKDNPVVKAAKIVRI
ncbi:hypothetical protein L1987_63197 [Smallanthus sonchifolius]|uniref:Uncharacterized protein n=1 Tax=Smallanthus sonchifolius TaxID=185202 RepID=A0ACB9CCH4_9ASTR|nr:hypothetical protein L1987_63197 [Smallanthus sonchifolius]